MANIKSAKKRIAITERNHRRNQAARSAVRTAIKRVLEGIHTKMTAPDLQGRLSRVFSLIDRAILKGILHKNTGSRYKSHMATAIAKLQGAA
jgi:small subunit ribosomal protein S20